MGCFPCLAGPSPVGEADANNPNAVLIKVRLSTGLQVPCYALPSDTVANIRRKVEREHGVQPNVAIHGRMLPPPIMARWQGKWVPADPHATMQQLGMQTQLKFADITDKLKQVKAFSHVHWALSKFQAAPV